MNPVQIGKRVVNLDRVECIVISDDRKSCTVQFSFDEMVLDEEQMELLFSAINKSSGARDHVSTNHNTINQERSRS